MNSNCTTENIDTDYVKQLEETVEILTSNINGSISTGYWYDRRANGNLGNPITRSDLKILGVCVAYIKLVNEEWIIYCLRRIETKKFSGYHFHRIIGQANKFYNDEWTGNKKGKTGMEKAKELALKSLV